MKKMKIRKIIKSATALTLSLILLCCFAVTPVLGRELAPDYKEVDTWDIRDIYDCKHVLDESGNRTQEADSIEQYPSNISFGVNMHPPTYQAYNERTLEQRYALAKRMGCKMVRINSSDLDYMDKEISLANAYGMKVMVVTRASIGTDIDDIEHHAESLCMLAARYNGKDGRGKVDYFQIGNETEVELYKASSASDPENPYTFYVEPIPEDPSIPNLRSFLPFFKVASDEFYKLVDAGETDAKLCINQCWFTCGPLRWYQEQGLRFDVVGLDWYFNARTATQKDTDSYLDRLHGYFPDKEIVICETNGGVGPTYNTVYDGKTDESLMIRNNPHYWDGLLAVLDIMTKKSFITGICVYEMCDEMYFRSSQEAVFGMVECTTDGIIGKPHPIYYDLQKRFGGSDSARQISLSEINLKPYEDLKVKTADDSGITIEKGDTDTPSHVTDYSVFDTDDDIKSDFDIDDEDEDDDDEDEASVVNGKDNIKKLTTTRTSYKLPLLATILTCVGILVVFAAAFLIYMILQKKKRLK